MNVWIAVLLLCFSCSQSQDLDSECRTAKQCDGQGFVYFGDGITIDGSTSIVLEKDTIEVTCSCKCQKNPNCVAWNIWKGHAGSNTGKCILKKSTTGEVWPYNNVKDFNYSSGKKHCDVFCTDESCIEDQVEYDVKANTVAHMQGQDLDKFSCSCACQEKEECKVWTFVKDPNNDGMNHCYLQSQAGKKASNKSSTSGHKSCKCETDKRCYFPKTDFKGGHLLHQADVSEDECSCLCSKNSECKGWTHVTEQRDCWLKKEMLVSKMSVQDWANSGLKNCINADEDCQGLTEPRCDAQGVKWYGDILGFLMSPTKDKCSCKCNSMEQCKSWTFQNGFCSLFKETTSKWVTSSADSGSKKCKPTMCTDPSCIEYNIGYSHNNLAHHKSTRLTKEECSCKCEDNDKCVAWTFAEGSSKDALKHCYLKHKADNREAKTNHVSGRKACSCKGYRKCQADGRRFAWLDTRVKDTKYIRGIALAMDCSCLCDREETCANWSHGDGACWLRGKDQSTGMVQRKIYTSGRKSGCICTDIKCIAEKTVILSDIIGSLSSFDFTKEECSCLCDENQKCQAWTFTKDIQPGKNRCSLHSGADQAKYSENSVAGTKACRTTMSTDKKCIWQKISFSSDKIKSLSSMFMTKEECSCSCKDDSQCQAWTFTTIEMGFNTCNLFSSAANSISAPNSVSGMQSCESCEPKDDGSVHAETKKECDRPGVAVLGEVFQNFPMKSKLLKECSCECQMNPNCVAWSSFKGHEWADSQCSLLKTANGKILDGKLRKVWPFDGATDDYYGSGSKTCED